MNTSVRTGLIVGVVALLIVGAGAFYFLNKPNNVSKKDWVEISSNKNTGEQIVKAKDGSFSIKLSKDWFIEEPYSNFVSSHAKNTSSCKVDFTSGKQEKTLEEIRNESEQEKITDVTVIKKEITDFNFKGTPAIRYRFDTHETGVGDSIIFAKNGLIFHAHLYSDISDLEICESYFSKYLDGIFIN